MKGRGMANDRMYLVHKPTGKELMIARWPAGGGWTAFGGEERMNKFFDEIGYSVGSEFILDTETEMCQRIIDAERIEKRMKKWKENA